MSFRTLPAVCLLLAAAALAAPAPALGQQAAPGSLAVPPPADTLHLGLLEAVARSLKQSPEVAQRQASRRHAAARHYQAKTSRWLPRFSLNTVHSVAPGLDRSSAPDSLADNALYLAPDVENDWTLDALRPFNAFTVEFGQPIWTWGELSKSIEAARQGERVERARTEEKELEVAFRTAQLYYNVLLTQQLSRLTGSARSKLDRAEHEVQSLLQQGDSTVTDADLFQVQISQQDFRRRVVELQQRGRTATSGLRRQLFVPRGTAALPVTPFLEPVGFSVQPLRHYVDLARENRPELTEAAAGLAARKAQVEVAKSDYYPKLFFGGRFGGRFAAGRPNQESAYIGENFVGSTTEAAFSIRQDLSFFQTRAKVEQAEADLGEVRAQQEAARQLVPFQVEQAWRALISAKGALAAQDRSFDLAKKWERLEQTNYDLGFGSTDALTKALQSRLKLQIAYYKAVRDYNMAVMKLLRSVGVLNDPQKVGTLVELPTAPAPADG